MLAQQRINFGISQRFQCSISGLGRRASAVSALRSDLLTPLEAWLCNRVTSE